MSLGRFNARRHWPHRTGCRGSSENGIAVHIAFAVSKATLLESAEKLKQMNLEFFLARSDTALYFFDYDNHIFELDTTDLDGALGELAGM